MLPNCWCSALTARTACCDALQRINSVLVCQKRFSRRSTSPPSWVPRKEQGFVEENLTASSADFLRHSAKSRILSPLKQQPWPRGVWTENSKRTGLIAQKIGVIPQWMDNGDRILCTLLHVRDNHVVTYVDPDTWFRQSVVGKRKSFNRFGPVGKLTVGAGEADPLKLTSAYRNVFEKSGIAPKQYIASFAITEDAKLEPGTPLYASHFKVGQYVDCIGKTIDWGFQGAVHRWGFRGLPKRNTTKAHRRVGAIGSTGDAKVHPGKRMPGHMGWEWRATRGILLIRINHKEQVLYVRGPGIPGDNGEFILVKDSFIDHKRIENPPFPTHYPREEDTSPPDDEAISGLFRFTNPSIEFPELETKTVRERGVRKMAKAKK